MMRLRWSAAQLRWGSRAGADKSSEGSCNLTYTYASGFDMALL